MYYKKLSYEICLRITFRCQWLTVQFKLVRVKSHLIKNYIQTDTNSYMNKVVW